MEFTKPNFFNEIRKKSVDLSLIRKFKTFVNITETENDTYKETALHHSCSKEFNTKNRVRLIKYLLENKLDPNSKNFKGLTPFQLNLKNFDDPEITRAFMRHSPDINFVDQNGNNCFHYAGPKNFIYLFEVTPKKKDLIEKENNKGKDTFDGKDFTEALLEIKNVEVIKFFANRLLIGELPVKAFKNQTLLAILDNSRNRDSFRGNINEERLMTMFQSIDNPKLNLEMLDELKFEPRQKFYYEALINEKLETFREAVTREENRKFLTGKIIQHIIKTTKNDNYILKILQLTDEVDEIPKDEETGNNIIHQLIQDSNTKSLNYLKDKKRDVFLEMSEEKNLSGKKPGEIIKVVKEVINEECIQEREMLRDELETISLTNKGLEEVNEDLEVEVRKRGKDINQKDKEIREIEGMMKKHVMELDEMQKKIEEERLGKKKCATGASKLEGKILELTKELNSSKSLENEQQKTIDLLTKELSNLRSELQLLHDKEVEEINKNYFKKVREIQQEDEESQKQVDSLTKEIDRLISELETTKKGNEELNSKIEDNARLCKEKLESELKKNNKSIKRIRKENQDKILKEKANHEKEMIEIKRFYEEGISEANEKKRAESEEIVERYQKEEERLRKQLEEIQENYKKNKLEFSDRVKSLMEQCRIEKENRSKEVNSACEKRIRETESSDRSKIKKEKIRLEKEIERINSEHKRKVKELVKKVEESERLRVDEKKRQTNLIEQNIDRQKEKCDVNLNIIKEEYEKKKKEIQDLCRREKASLHKKHNEKLEKLEKNRESLERIAESRRREIEALEEKFRNTISTKNGEISNLKSRHEEKIKTLTQKIKVLKEAHKSEKEILRKKYEKEKEDLRKELESKNDTLQETHVQALELKEKNYNSRIEKLESKYKQRIKEREKLIVEVDKKLQSEIKRLTNEKDKAIEELKKELNDTEEKAINNLTEIMAELPSVTSLKKLKVKIRGAIDVSKQYRIEPLSKFSEQSNIDKYNRFEKKLDKRLEYIGKDIVLQKIVIERPTLSVILREKQKDNLIKFNAYFSKNEYPILGKEKADLEEVKNAYKDILVKEKDMFVKRWKPKEPEPIESLEITTKVRSVKTRFKGITTVNPHLYIDILTEHIINLFMNTRKKLVAHHVYLFGRSGSGKTFFWTKLVEKLVDKFFTNEKLNDVAENKNLNYQMMTNKYSQKMSETKVDKKLRIVKVSRVETIGHYAGKQPTKPAHIRFTVLDERNQKKRDYESNFEKEKKRTSLPGIYYQQRNGEDFYDNVVLQNKNKKKLNWRKESLKREPDIEVLKLERNFRKYKFQYKYADFTNKDVLKDAIVDDRMEIKYKKPETGHYSTRNHIQKRIYVKIYKEFEKPGSKKDLVVVKQLQLTFMIFAGSEQKVVEKKESGGQIERKEEFIYFQNTENTLPNVIMKDTVSGVTKYDFITTLIRELIKHNINATYAIMVWPAAEEILGERLYITQTKNILEKITKKYPKKQKQSSMLFSLAKMFL